MENRLREKDEEIENIRWVNMALYQQAKREGETENIRGV